MRPSPCLRQATPLIASPLAGYCLGQWMWTRELDPWLILGCTFAVGAIAGVVALLADHSVRLLCYQMWWRYWRALPGHNPYKPGDSE